jgi:hypothetical protein
VLPSWWCGFDSRRPLHLEAQVSGWPAGSGECADAVVTVSVTDSTEPAFQDAAIARTSA